MLLKNLIKKHPKKLENLSIKGLAIDSRKVKKGYIFFAIDGRRHKGHQFIKEAIRKKASLIICSKKTNYKKINSIIVNQRNIKDILVEACKKFYNNKPKNIFLVTGTNGKSSVANFFHQILMLNKIPVASIGTLGVKIEKKSYALSLTSPDIITLNEYLTKIKEEGVDNVIIEASSHGLYQQRLHGLTVKAGMFTNLSQDHLDYHNNFKKYLNAKLILFNEILKKNGYLISDSKIKEFKRLTKIAKKRKLKILDSDKIYNKINNLKLKLIGDFQYKNLSMAVQSALLCDLSFKKIEKSLYKIQSVEGRLSEIKTFKNGSKVFIDFAHTPEALEKVLCSIKSNFSRKISVVFGCGGQRDSKKRPLMGKIASKYCEKIYITDDNPRYENAKKIRKEIIKGIRNSNYFNIGSRSNAIKTAVMNSDPGEIILVAGKGHETLQDYGKMQRKISDKSIVKKIKLNKKNLSSIDLEQNLNSKILSSILKTKKIFKFNKVSINSKKVKNKDLFVCIKGKSKDGNHFISEAISKGANYYLTSKHGWKYKNKKIKFNNTIKFLEKFGLAKRKKSNAKIIAITGSSGKTTLKFLIGNLLKTFGNTYFSPKSYNNHIGVPLSLCNLNYNDEYGVFEIGMSKKGEIKTLSNLVKPDIAIITNVAEAHIENFKDLKGIAKAKAEIIQNIKDKGTLILNRDDKFFNFFNKIAIKRKLKIITFGANSNSEIKLNSNFKTKNYHSASVKIANKIIKIKYKEINIYNLLASIAVIETLNLDINKIIKNLFNFKYLSGRGKISKILRFNKSFQLIDESYNANPFSVEKSILNLSSLNNHKNKKYVLLGDMLELGNRSDFYHKNISKVINKSNINKLFVYGHNSMNTYKHTMIKKRGNILQNLDDFDDVFKDVINTNDYLMIKGSNSTYLYKISEKLIRESN